MPGTRARAVLIEGVENDVLNNHRAAFNDSQTMEKWLVRSYDKAGRELLQSITDLRTQVEASGGEWTLADMGKFQRMDNLLYQINQQLQILGATEVNYISQNLSTVYQDQYMRTIFTIGKYMNVNISMDRINPAMIQQTLNYPWSGAMFSDRIWENKAQLGKNLRIGLTQSMILGESVGKMAKRINEGINTATSNAVRVARTESMRVAYVSERHAMEDNNIETVEYLATIPSERTCSICGGSHGKQFPMGKEIPLPRHPHCRCTYIPVVRPMRDNEYNELTNSIQGAKNYEEWVKKQQAPPQPVTTSVDLYSGENGRKIAQSFNDEAANKIGTYYNLEDFDYKLKKIDGLRAQGYYGKSLDKAEEMIKLNKAILDGTAKGVYEIDANAVMDITINDKDGKKSKTYLSYLPVTEYEEKDGGKYFINYSKKLAKKEQMEIEATISKLINENPRAVGIKVQIDNGKLDKQSNKARGLVTMGYHHPKFNHIVMRDFKNYESNVGGVGKLRFLNTMAHELGHIPHSKHPKLTQMTLTDKEWGEWKGLVEDFYDNYRVKKLVDFKSATNNTDRWSRVVYPIDAEDYYKDKSKEHFYQELFAESTAIVHVGEQEELNRLDKYFPKVRKWLQTIYNVKGVIK